MRRNTPFKRIAVRKEIYERLLEDRKEFEKTIGGGKWSISDTIEEYLKMISSSKKRVFKVVSEEKKSIGDM